MIGEERTAFFLVMSDTDKTFNFILAMLLYQLFDVNTAIADRNPGSHCKIPINCILDELANIGRIPDLDVKIATLRSRWIYITAILQSVTQLKKMYKDNADIIEGNCDTTLFLGRCDLETNKKISERLGKFTATVRNRSESHGRQGSWSESENKIGKELMAAADLGNNPEKFSGDDCIVFIKNAFPFLDKKYRTIDHPRYHELREVGEFNLDDWNWDRKCERAHRARGRGDALAHRGGARLFRPRVLHVGDPRRGRPRRSTYLTRRGGSTGRQRHTGGARDNRRENPDMAFFNQLLNYLWQILTFVGGITAAVGVFRWVSGGQGPRRARPRRARSGSSPSAAQWPQSAWSEAATSPSPRCRDDGGNSI